MRVKHSVSLVNEELEGLGAAARRRVVNGSPVAAVHRIEALLSSGDELLQAGGVWVASGAVHRLYPMAVAAFLFGVFHLKVGCRKI